jgi:cytochrome P450 family 9
MEDITAQCMIFFLAGFDTVSTAIYLMAYSLAVNQDVQRKLHEEIDELNEKLNGRMVTYEDIQSLNYLDMCLSESLRMNPPVVNLDRRCNQTTTLVNSDGTKVELHPGDGVYFPVSCLHSDPKFYPEPEKFIPERFSKENAKNIHPFAYLPFGVGPRNCIGSRFALMETKALFVSILSKFTIEVNSKTEIPLQFMPDTFQNRPKNGVWLSLKVKQKKN